MNSLILAVALGLAATLGAGEEGLIVFDRGADAADLSPALNLAAPSALFTLDPAVPGEDEETPKPTLVPGTRDGSTNIMASWFPDRTKIVYVSNRDNGNRGQIWTATVAAEGQTRITENEGNDLYPTVSPDAALIAFASTADIYSQSGEDLPEVADPAVAANLDLYVVDTSGGSLHRLTDDAFEDRDPQFSLDGGTVYFVKVGVTPQIFSIPVDGEPGDETPVLDEDDFPLVGRDLSVYGDPLGDILYFKNLQGVLTIFDTFTLEQSTGVSGLTRPTIGQDAARVVHTTGGNLAITTLAGDTSRSLLLTGDVLFARWASPGETPLPDLITVERPNGGETWPQGATRLIEWSSGEKADESVKIELSQGGLKPSVIVDSTENDGEFEWVIPADQEVGEDYLVTISFKKDGNIVDTSDAPFSIVAPEDCPVPAAPKNVVATDGVYGDRVEVSWKAVPGALEYLVYRNRVDSFTTAHLVDTVETNEYIDPDTLPLVIQEGCRGPVESRANYYYFIKAVGDCGVSGFSLSDVGYRGVEDSEAAQVAGDVLVMAALAAAFILANRRKKSNR